MAYSRNKKEEVQEKKELEELGALWKRKAKSGATYYTGKLKSGENIVAFFNKYAGESNQPELRIYIQERYRRLSSFI